MLHNFTATDARAWLGKAFELAERAVSAYERRHPKPLSNKEAADLVVAAQAKRKADVRGVGVISADTVPGRDTIWVVHHDYSIRPGSLIQSVGNPGSEGDGVMKVISVEVAVPPGETMGLLVRPAKEG